MSNKKRDNGTGTIRQRPDGKWEGRAPAPYKKSFYGKTESEVKKKLRAYLEQRLKESCIDVVNITVDEYLEKFIHEVKINELKPKTLDHMDYVAKHLIHPTVGAYRMGELTSFDVQRMVNTIKKQGYSHSTIKRAFGLLSQLYKHGMTVSPPVVSRNPCMGVKLPQKNKTKISEMGIFTEEEIAKICAEATRIFSNSTPVYRNGYGVVLLLFTGLRFCELSALEWKNIDFDKRVLYVRGNAVTARDWDGDGKRKTIVQDSSKTKYSERTVPLCDAAYNALLHLKLQNPGKYVLVTKNGTLVTHRNFLHTFSAILEKAGVPHRGLHACRHTFASMLFKRGVEAKVVSELLGHADVAITYDIYIHLIQEQKQIAISMLPALRELGTGAV